MTRHVLVLGCPAVPGDNAPTCVDVGHCVFALFAHSGIVGTRCRFILRKKYKAKTRHPWGFLPFPNCTPSSIFQYLHCPPVVPTQAFSIYFVVDLFTIHPSSASIMRVFPCQKRHQKNQEPERRVPVISAPFGFRHENAEMKSAIEAMSTRLPEFHGELNSFVGHSGSTNPQESTTTITTATIADKENASRYAHNARAPTPPVLRGLRSVFSTPELREPDVVGARVGTSNRNDYNNGNAGPMPRLRTLRSGQSGNSRRRWSWWSANTDVIQGRRTVMRTLLDTMGCTQADHFDINDFQRVQPPSNAPNTRPPVAAPAFHTMNTPGGFHAAPEAHNAPVYWHNGRVIPSAYVTQARAQY